MTRRRPDPTPTPEGGPLDGLLADVYLGLIHVDEALEHVDKCLQDVDDAMQALSRALYRRGLIKGDPAKWDKTTIAPRAN